MGVMEMAPRDRMAERNVDLAALNDAERGALELLAEGHTVKSIADLTGRSVAAINERLREARRKTGVGSSRELARLLKAQKNRDEKIDLSGPAAPALATDPQADPQERGRPRKGRIVMALILIGGMAAALVAIETPRLATASHVPPDPALYAALPPSQPPVTQLHAELRSEGRDAPWAERMEAGLRRRYATVPHLNDRGQVRVMCGSTLCEISNALPDVDQSSPQDREALYRGLGSIALHADIIAMGLTDQGNLFTQTKDKPARPVYFAFWRRATNGKGAADPLFDRVRFSSEEQAAGERGMRADFKQLRLETRDPLWAPGTEKRVAAILRSVPNLVNPQNGVRVSCAATLCELTARTEPGASQPTIDAFYRDLQSDKLSNAIEGVGLKFKAMMFGGVPGQKGRNLYIAYYSRTGG